MFFFPWLLKHDTSSSSLTESHRKHEVTFQVVSEEDEMDPSEFHETAHPKEVWVDTQAQPDKCL